MQLSSIKKRLWQWILVLAHFNWLWIFYKFLHLLNYITKWKGQRSKHPRLKWSTSLFKSRTITATKVKDVAHGLYVKVTRPPDSNLLGEPTNNSTNWTSVDVCKFEGVWLVHVCTCSMHVLQYCQETFMSSRTKMPYLLMVQQCSKNLHKFLNSLRNIGTTVKR